MSPSMCIVVISCISNLTINDLLVHCLLFNISWCLQYLHFAMCLVDFCCLHVIQVIWLHIMSITSMSNRILNKSEYVAFTESSCALAWLFLLTYWLVGAWAIFATFLIRTLHASQLYISGAANTFWEGTLGCVSKFLLRRYLEPYRIYFLLNSILQTILKLRLNCCSALVQNIPNQFKILRTICRTIIVYYKKIRTVRNRSEV